MINDYCRPKIQTTKTENKPLRAQFHFSNSKLKSLRSIRLNHLSKANIQNAMLHIINFAK